MPIRPDLRHFYRGPDWEAARNRILRRAGGTFDQDGQYTGGARCERCGVPDQTRTVRACGWWAPCRSMWFALPVLEMNWHAPVGGRIQRASFPRSICREVYIVIAVCHFNHVPGDDRDENLRAWCQWCHLEHDRTQHERTRTAHKDAARPLLQEIV